MNYWNTGTINVSKKYMDVVIDLLETESITCVMEDPDNNTIHIQCEGDIESGLDEVIACCKKKHIYLNGKIDFTGDASGRYVIKNNELHVLSMEERVIADASTGQLLQEIQKRNNVTNAMIKIAEDVMSDTPSGVSDIIRSNQYIIYHMPRKYGNLEEAIKPVRSDLMAILSFCAKHEPIIYRQSYTYFFDSNRLNAIRHDTTKSVSNRHFNYLCCLGLIKKIPQYKGHMTKINQNFMEQTKQQHPINTVSILRYTPEKLEEIEQRAILLRKNKITAGNLSCDKLMACGLEELAKEVYPSNMKSSIYRKKKVYGNVLEVAHRLCDQDGYTTKEAICEVTGMTKDTLHKLLTVFAQDWKKHFTYHAPNKEDKEKYNLTTNQWILKENESQ